MNFPKSINISIIYLSYAKRSVLDKIKSAFRGNFILIINKKDTILFFFTNFWLLNDWKKISILRVTWLMFFFNTQLSNFTYRIVKILKNNGNWHLSPHSVPTAIPNLSQLTTYLRASNSLTLRNHFNTPIWLCQFSTINLLGPRIPKRSSLLPLHLTPTMLS